MLMLIELEKLFNQLQELPRSVRFGNIRIAADSGGVLIITTERK